MSTNNKQREGLRCKLIAMKHFVEQGYYVFNETNQGPVDFIALNMKGDIKFIECKKLAKRGGLWRKGSRINRVLTERQKILNRKWTRRRMPIIQIMYVDPENSKIEFQEHRNNA
jgi:hypothetical protein|tara:strand:- start:15 stop:356 length:342 start_codon:yes stop_codon:yes gene_type:complete